MFLHGLNIGSPGEEGCGFGAGGISSSSFLPARPDVKVLYLVVFHLFMCGPFSRATWEIYLTNSSCWESKFQSKKLVALLITPAPFL